MTIVLARTISSAHLTPQPFLHLLIILHTGLLFDVATIDLNINASEHADGASNADAGDTACLLVRRHRGSLIAHSKDILSRYLVKIILIYTNCILILESSCVIMQHVDECFT